MLAREQCLLTKIVINGGADTTHRFHGVNPCGLPIRMAVIPTEPDIVGRAIQINRWRGALGAIAHRSILTQHLRARIAMPCTERKPSEDSSQ